MTTGSKLLAAALAALLIGCNARINDDIAIAADAQTGGASVVNGAIDVGARAEVSGDVSTVNGPVTIQTDATVRRINVVNGEIQLGPGAKAVGIRAVNGDITLAEAAETSRSIQLTNGEITLRSQVRVGGDVSIVAGGLSLEDAQVAGDVTTTSADVHLSGASAIRGSLTVEKRKGVDTDEPPTIIVGPGSRIDGPLMFEAPARVYVSEQAQIGAVSGVVKAQDIVRYAGAEAPIT